MNREKKELPTSSRMPSRTVFSQTFRTSFISDLDTYLDTSLSCSAETSVFCRLWLLYAAVTAA